MGNIKEGDIIMPDNNQQTIKRDGFFKTVLKSIKDFDKYEQFGIEGMGKTCLYLLQIVAIITIIVVAILIYQFSTTMQSAVIYFNDNVQEMSYTDGILTVNSNQKLEVDTNSTIAQKIIVDTSDLTDEQIEQYRTDLDGLNSGIILLKDKILIKNDMLTSITETTYTNILSQYNITNLDKQSVLDYIYTNQTQVYISVAIVEFIYMFAVYLTSILMDTLILALLGLIVARIAGMKIKFSACFGMGVHALTLPIILNILYIILNAFTGYTIKYFQIMYTAISYIYIVAAILIIRSDYIKRQMELDKIKSEQEKVRAELDKQKEEDKEEEEKRQEEKQKQKEKESGANNGKQKDPDTGEKPEGSNV